LKILGLDISTKTGFALIEDGQLINYGLIKISPTGHSDYELLDLAQALSKEIAIKVSNSNPDKIAIEQTNPGRFRVQKLLEFIHMATLIDLRALGAQSKVEYLDTSRWRSLIKMRLSKDQKDHNKKVKAKKAKGKITAKHLSVAWVNAKFDKKFKQKDNDICDAICLAYAAYIQPVRHTDIDLNAFFQENM
jgi:Holliday junction resolvasome RuvABC endonuclease subunit